MLRKTLAATPQAKRGPCWEPPEGAARTGVPHTPGRQLEQGGDLLASQEVARAPWGRAGGCSGVNESCKTRSREHLSAWARPGCLHLQSPQREGSALELHKEDWRETREKASGGADAKLRATAGPEPTIRHRDTHKTGEQSPPQTRGIRTDWRGLARPPRQLNPSRHGGGDHEPDPVPCKDRNRELGTHATSEDAAGL